MGAWSVQLRSCFRLAFAAAFAALLLTACAGRIADCDEAVPCGPVAYDYGGKLLVSDAANWSISRGLGVVKTARGELFLARASTPSDHLEGHVTWRMPDEREWRSKDFTSNVPQLQIECRMGLLRASVDWDGNFLEPDQIQDVTWRSGTLAATFDGGEPVLLQWQSPYAASTYLIAPEAFVERLRNSREVRVERREVAWLFETSKKEREVLGQVVETNTVNLFTPPFSIAASFNVAGFSHAQTALEAHCGPIGQPSGS